MFKVLRIFTDGGSRGNPGPAGIGAVIYDSDLNKLAEVSEFIGVATNNQAEYQAVVAALFKAEEFKPEKIFVYLDSELVVKQLNQEYKIKNQGLAPLFVKIYNQTIKYQKVTFSHIPREQNNEADALVNQALDRELK